MHNLSGDWNGLYSYPATLEPVMFTAHLHHAEAWLSGTTVEAAPIGTLTATLNGSAEGLQLRFLKMYDRDDEQYDAVQYAGAMDADGQEIWGSWSIPGRWSGTFLMLRPAQAATEMRAKWTARV